MTNNRLLTDKELLEASLVSKYPFSAIKDVLIETSKYQDDKSVPLAAKEIFEELEYDFGISMPTKMGQPFALISIEIIDSADRERYQTLKKKYGV